MAPTAPIDKVAVIGVTGRIGGAFTKALLRSGKHNITALTRKGSKGKIPEGVKKVIVDYDDEENVVEALRGQQFLIITLSTRAPSDLHRKIVQAAGKAGVPYIMPNVFAYDIENENLSKGPVFSTYRTNVYSVKEAGSSYVNLCCGYWYEWSLALGENFFGINIKDRTVIFFDDGNTKINVSTWDQCGRAVANLLALPESGAKPSVSDWKNGIVYIDSWRLSQRDMLDSLHRVLGTTDKDWKITYEPSEKRYNDGIADLSVHSNFAKAIYSRIFMHTGDGDYESTHGLANDVLGLPKEDLDEATKRTIEMVESGWNPFA